MKRARLGSVSMTQHLWASGENLTKRLKRYVQKIVVHLEVPNTIPVEDAANQVADTLIEVLGAQVISMRVASTTETITLT